MDIAEEANQLLGAASSAAALLGVGLHDPDWAKAPHEAIDAFRDAAPRLVAGLLREIDHTDCHEMRRLEMVRTEKAERERDRARVAHEATLRQFGEMQAQRDEARAALAELVRLKERSLNAAVPTPDAWLAAWEAAWAEARRIVALGEEGGA